MNIQNIISTLSHIVPFWSTHILHYAGLGNEYSMLITLVLQNMIEFVKDYFTESIIYSVLALCIVLIIAIKNNLIDIKLFERKQTILTVFGNEKDGVINYSDKLCLLSKCIVEKYNYSNILIGKTSKHILMLNCVKDFKLTNDVYLTIARNEHEVQYIFKSYTVNVSKFIEEVIKEYDTHETKCCIIFFGKETFTTYEYSDILLALVYTAIHKYNFKNIIVKNQEHKDDEKNINNPKFDTTQLLQDDHLFNLAEDITLSISRIGEIVKYELKSSETDLNNFVDSCVIYYNLCSKKSKYTTKFILHGYEQLRYGRYIFMYPKSILALCHYLINNKKHGEFIKITNHDLCTNRYNEITHTIDKTEHYLILDTKCLEFDGIVLTIDRNGGADNMPVIISYTFESNTVHIQKFIDNLTREYEQYLETNQENKLYHFVFTGFQDNKPEFTSELIYDNGPILNETFDNIITEHNERIVSDMERLKDTNHYRHFGLKRKLSYLFHGEPGTGKTSTIIAMAMKDKRHVISIRITSQMTSNEFSTIMSLKEINDIKIPRNQRIMLFEEIDYALSKFGENSLPDKMTSRDNIIVVDKESQSSSYNRAPQKDDDTLSYDTLLNEFDGIRSYNGDIFVITTNNIEKIHKTLYRERRLTPIKFVPKKDKEILAFIKKYFPAFDHDCTGLCATSAQLTTLCEIYYGQANIEQTLFDIMEDKFQISEKTD